MKPPPIQGQVVSERQGKMARRRGVFGKGLMTLFFIMSPFEMLIGSVTGRHNLKECTVHQLRIEDASGIQYEVRVEGDYLSGSMGLGDYVSIWGIDQGGTIVLQQGFNHTVNAEIRFRA